mgnify:CR=1 FL=1
MRRIIVGLCEAAVVAVLLLLAATSARAATFDTAGVSIDEFGCFTAVSAPGRLSQSVRVDGAVNLLLYSQGTIGTSTSVGNRSGDVVNWTALTGTATALGVVSSIDFPNGYYTVNVSACTGCTLTFCWRSSRLK